MNIEAEPDTEQRLTLVKLMEEFRIYHSTNNNTANFYVYFKKAGTILNKESYYEQSLFHELYLKNRGSGFDQWKQVIDNIHRGKFIGLAGADTSDVQRTGSANIVFAQSLPLEDPNHSLATLIVELDESRLQQAMGAMKMYDVGNVYIMNETNQILATSESDLPVPLKLSDVRLSNDSGVVDADLNGESVKVSYIKSRLLDWKYVYTCQPMFTGKRPNISAI
jgi:hypothetical protein